MATKRQGRSGIFKNTSRTPRKRPAPSGPQAALAALRAVTYEWDIIADTLAWGPNASEVLALPPDALPQTGRAFSQMIEPGSGPSHQDAVLSDDGADRAYGTRYALRFGPGQVLVVQDSGRWLMDAQGRPFLARGLLRADVEASVPELLPAAIRARSDLLVRIQEDIDEAVSLSHTCTLIAGSLLGDDAAAAENAARRLRPMLRRGDRVAALGANRFALTLACCPASEVPSAMKRVAALLADDGDARLGAACSPDHTFEAVKLLRFAETALEAAVARSEPAVIHKVRPAASSKARDKAADELVGALNDRRLTLTCRPVVDAQTRRPALVQAVPGILASGGGRTVTLGVVPSSRDGCLSTLVDGRLLELAADYLVHHPEERLALPIALATLHDREWLPMLAAHLGARPGIASRLIVEIPETALADAGKAWGRLDAMKALGIGTGLSGFGSGHASLAHLKNLPIDLLRIDGVFIQTLRRSTADRLFVRTLIDMAHHLGLATAAEWVDDEASARMLATWGVDYMQGPLFGEAEPVAEPQSILQRLRRA